MVRPADPTLIVSPRGQKRKAAQRARQLSVRKNAPNKSLITLREQAHFFDVSQDAIFLWRHPGRIESWNKGAIDLYGYEPEQAIGRVLGDLLRTKFPVPWAAIENELRKRGTWRGELVHHARDGREILVSTRLGISTATATKTREEGALALARSQAVSTAFRE
jgi:PAS domain S-box-containing protein